MDLTFCLYCVCECVCFVFTCKLQTFILQSFECVCWHAGVLTWWCSGSCEPLISLLRAPWICLRIRWSFWVSMTMKRNGSWFVIRWDTNIFICRLTFFIFNNDRKVELRVGYAYILIISPMYFSFTEWVITHSEIRNEWLILKYVSHFIFEQFLFLHFCNTSCL